MEERRNQNIDQGARIALERTLFDSYLNQIKTQYELALARGDEEISSNIASELERCASMLGKGARQRRNLVPSTSTLPLHGRIKEKYLVEEMRLNSEIDEFTEEKKAELKKVEYNRRMLERILENASLVKNLADNELRAWNRQYDAPAGSLDGKKLNSLVPRLHRMFEDGLDWIDKPAIWKHRGTHLMKSRGLDFPHNDPLVKRVMGMGDEIERLSSLNFEKGEGEYFGIPFPEVSFIRSRNAKEHHQINQGLRDLIKSFNTGVVVDIYERIFFRTLKKDDYKAFRYLSHPSIKPIVARLDHYRELVESLPDPELKDTTTEENRVSQLNDGRLMLVRILSHCSDYISGAGRFKKRKMGEIAEELFEVPTSASQVGLWLGVSSNEEYAQLRRKYLPHKSEVFD